MHELCYLTFVFSYMTCRSTYILGMPQNPYDARLVASFGRRLGACFMLPWIKPGLQSLTFAWVC